MTSEAIDSTVQNTVLAVHKKCSLYTGRA